MLDDAVLLKPGEMADDALLLKPGEKIDDLQRSGLRIIQDPGKFCFGMDAVLLTGFAQEGIGKRSMAREDLLDLGTGTGIIPLLMSAKTDCRSGSGSCREISGRQTRCSRLLLLAW